MNDKILTIKKSTLVDIANEVRAKTGSTDLIKVADLDDAVAELSGGGVVEVDVLPSATVVEKTVLPASTYDVNEDGNWTLTSEPVYIGNIYINTALSVEETIAEIKKVTQDLDAVYNKEMTAYEYYIDIYDDADTEDYSECFIELFNYFNRDEDNNPTGYSDRWVISLGHWDSEGNPIFDDAIFDTENGGWNPEFNGVINFNKTKPVCSYIEWNECIDWGGDSYIVNGVISMNSELVNLIYTGEEVPNPEFNPEAIYKLPDETMWMWSVEEEKFVQLHKEQKVDVMKYSKYNNPDFGFYYGQTFMLDDPITIKLKPIFEWLDANNETGFMPINNHNAGYDDRAPFVIDIPLDGGRGGETVDLSQGNCLQISFGTGYVDESGYFIGGSKDPNTNNYTAFNMYVDTTNTPYSIMEYSVTKDISTPDAFMELYNGEITFTLADVIREGATKYESDRLVDYTKWPRQYCQVVFQSLRGMENFGFTEPSDYSLEEAEEIWNRLSLQSEKNAIYKFLKIGK